MLGFFIEAYPRGQGFYRPEETQNQGPAGGRSPDTEGTKTVDRLFGTAGQQIQRLLRTAG
jgi:hypothetical protein